ncbi:MAG: hypothetical protein CMJ83_11705 [Planctomycetes bacterium]|nr:hypothetical protein [Planctomycetota bacterium]
MIALFVVTLTGFVALSYEILWYRACSFASGGSPVTFGVLLFAYLIGIAWGARRAGRRCRDEDASGDSRQLLRLAVYIALANLCSFLVAPLLGVVCTFAPWPLAMVLVGISAGLLGAVLPLVSHFAIPADDRAGARLSYLYLGNIVGSAAGSLLTGFVLMDGLGFAGISSLLLAVGMLLAAALAVASSSDVRRFAVAGSIVAVAAIGIVLRDPVHVGLYERLKFKSSYDGQRFVHVVENRHGVIAVTDDGLVVGGGVFDGVVSLDLMDESRNWIARPYVLPAFHAAPKEVLLIGLSAGPWAQVVVNLPGVERLTCIEINPGYLEIIKRHDVVSSLLTNPKVKIEVDDGRRWINRHPERKFDLIVQNTTWYWRGHSTHILSREYLEMCKSRMNPNGVMILNATGSPDVQKTCLDVFDHGLRLYNTMVVGPDPLSFDGDRLRQALTTMRIDGRRVLDPSIPAHQTRLEELVALGAGTTDLDRDRAIVYRDVLDPYLRGWKVITDDNMQGEWRALRWWPDK